MSFSLPAPAESARVCPSLQTAAEQPNFNEAVIGFAVASARHGDDWSQESVRRARRMAEGKDLYFLGNPVQPDEE